MPRHWVNTCVPITAIRTICASWPMSRSLSEPFEAGPAPRASQTSERMTLREGLHWVRMPMPFTYLFAPTVARIRPESRRSAFALRRAMASMGYQETINFSFVEERWEHELAGNPDPIQLLNPIASQMSVMRSSLLGSLLQVLKFNLDRKAERVRVFELGRVFARDDTVSTTDTTVRGVRQPMRVAGLAYGFHAVECQQIGVPRDVQLALDVLDVVRLDVFRIAGFPS